MRVSNLTGRFLLLSGRLSRRAFYFRFVRREKAMLFQWVKGPPGEVLPPEATGAAVEVTKPLKPSVKRVTKYGGSASVQAVTRVNAEQASKRKMHRPT